MTNQTTGKELEKLQHLSYRVGSDPEQVQGAGGNTSIKVAETLWIKASGMWLMNACSSDLFVPVALPPLLQALEEGDARAEKSTDFIIRELNPLDLRPSIETTVHAVLPQRVVVHIHCVDTIALAVRQDAETLLTSTLAGFNWLWVPYFRPGLPLSRYINAHRKTDTDVIVLGNHGLVVAADTVADVEALLLAVRAVVKQAVRSSPPANLQKLGEVSRQSDYQAADDADAHSLAMDPISMQIASAGSLYPDHVIFLGDGTVVANAEESVTDCVTRIEASTGAQPVSIVVPDAGVLVRSDANAGQQAMVRCIADVTARISDPQLVKYLNDEEVYALTHWEAEHYRQKLNDNTAP